MEKQVSSIPYIKPKFSIEFIEHQVHDDFDNILVKSQQRHVNLAEEMSKSVRHLKENSLLALNLIKHDT